MKEAERHLADPSQSVKPSATELQRFWSKVEKTDTCWNWKAAQRKNGYGAFGFRGANRQPHRISWLITHGFSPVHPMIVCHTCDNRLCVNPDHLWIGTHQDNSNDAKKKGRTQLLNSFKGEQNRNSKLRLTDVREIRSAIQRGIKPSNLARAYGVSDYAISALKRGITWKNIV